MRESTVHTPLAQGMWIALHTAAYLRLGDIVGPYASVCNEEALFRREAHEGLSFLGFCRLFKRIEGDLETTVVGKILT